MFNKLKAIRKWVDEKIILKKKPTIAVSPIIDLGESKLTKDGMFMTAIWPKIFSHSDFQYEEKDKKILKAMACADGLSGWGLCMSGFKAPKPFGMGMVKIGNILDNTAVTSDDLMEYSRNKRWEEINGI